MERVSPDLKFVFNHKLVKIGAALDIGSGFGFDARYMFQNGMGVTAIDKNLKVGNYPSQIKFINCFIEDFEFQECSLVNAQWVLPFIRKNRFEDIIFKIKKSLLPGGIFLGQFFGLEDQWNKDGKDFVFVTKAMSQKLLFGLELIKFCDVRIRGYLRNGDPKFWHYYEFICRKP